MSKFIILQNLSKNFSFFSLKYFQSLMPFCAYQVPFLTNLIIEIIFVLTDLYILVPETDLLHRAVKKCCNNAKSADFLMQRVVKLLTLNSCNANSESRVCLNSELFTSIVCYCEYIQICSL